LVQSHHGGHGGLTAGVIAAVDETSSIGQDPLSVEPKASSSSVLGPAGVWKVSSLGTTNASEMPNGSAEHLALSIRTICSPGWL
jgi:hypothetical protein